MKFIKLNLLIKSTWICMVMLLNVMQLWYGFMKKWINHGHILLLSLTQSYLCCINDSRSHILWEEHCLALCCIHLTLSNFFLRTNVQDKEWSSEKVRILVHLVDIQILICPSSSNDGITESLKNSTTKRHTKCKRRVRPTKTIPLQAPDPSLKIIIRSSYNLHRPIT